MVHNHLTKSGTSFPYCRCCQSEVKTPAGLPQIWLASNLPSYCFILYSLVLVWMRHMILGHLSRLLSHYVAVPCPRQVYYFRYILQTCASNPRCAATQFSKISTWHLQSLRIPINILCIKSSFFSVLLHYDFAILFLCFHESVHWLFSTSVPDNLHIPPSLLWIPNVHGFQSTVCFIIYSRIRRLSIERWIIFFIRVTKIQSQRFPPFT